MSKQICLKKTTNKEGRLEFDFFDSNIGRSNFMKKKIYEWKYGENDCLKYYEVKFKKGKDYLCIYANKKYPDLWMGMYIKARCDITLEDKTFNDRQRKKESKAGILMNNIPRTTRLLSGNPDYMKKKIIWAYEHNLREISK